MKAMKFRIGSLMLALLLLALPSGCSDKDGGKPKIRKKSGVASKIDVENRVVSMTILDKTGTPRELQGTFKDDTVVMINGRTASIKDIRTGDKVEVEGYREGEGENQKLIAIRVTVDRPDEKDWKSTGKGDDSKPAPTTQPANG